MDQWMGGLRLRAVAGAAGGYLGRTGWRARAREPRGWVLSVEVKAFTGEWLAGHGWQGAPTTRTGPPPRPMHALPPYVRALLHQQHCTRWPRPHGASANLSCPPGHGQRCSTGGTYPYGASVACPPPVSCCHLPASDAARTWAGVGPACLLRVVPAGSPGAPRRTACWSHEPLGRASLHVAPGNLTWARLGWGLEIEPEDRRVPGLLVD